MLLLVPWIKQINKIAYYGKTFSSPLPYYVHYTVLTELDVVKGTLPFTYQRVIDLTFFRLYSATCFLNCLSSCSSLSLSSRLSSCLILSLFALSSLLMLSCFFSVSCLILSRSNSSSLEVFHIFNKSLTAI